MYGNHEKKLQITPGYHQNTPRYRSMTILFFFEYVQDTHSNNIFKVEMHRYVIAISILNLFKEKNQVSRTKNVMY